MPANSSPCPCGSSSGLYPVFSSHTPLSSGDTDDDRDSERMLLPQLKDLSDVGLEMSST